MHTHSFVSQVYDRRRFLAGLGASLLLAGCGTRSRSQGPADPRVSYYTCAMHPSVRSDDPKGKCPICGMDLVPVFKEGEGSKDQSSSQTSTFTVPPDQARFLGVASAPLAFREAVRNLRVPGRAVEKSGVEAFFFEGDAVLLAPGQGVEVAFEALPGVNFAGRMVSLARVSDEVSHRVTGRIALDRPDPRIRPGFEAAVEVPIPLGRRLMAPLSAVLPTGERHVVLIDLGEGRIEPRYVETGLALPDGWEIVSGAKEGERLVTAANFLVDAQARIEGALKGWGEAR